MTFYNYLRNLVPGEFLEPNLRLYSFLFLIVLVSVALLIFPVGEYKGYVDPFYSPTILVLPLIGLFRLTCYAFRKDYNRHLFTHPLSCPAYSRADAKARDYSGETSGLFKVENLHRYFMYMAVAVMPFFYYDLYVSLTYFGGIVLRMGSVLMIADIAALTLYVFSCHAVRSLIGGRKDCFSCMKMTKARKGLYNLQSKLNEHHELLAWLSLITIVSVDLYIRAISGGIFADYVIAGIV